jgi:hypothetical protein
MSSLVKLKIKNEEEEEDMKVKKIRENKEVAIDY